MTPNWNAAPTFGRRSTILRSLATLHSNRPEGGAVLVETGTLRDENPAACSGDGWSTVAWGWFAQETHGHAWTVDLNPDAIAACRRLTEPWADSITYVAQDSHAFLAEWDLENDGRIDLAYLDSLDYFDHAASEAHALREAQLMLPLLAENGLVLFDDSSGGEEGWHGKGKQAIPWLISQGMTVLFAEEGQVLLGRKKSEENL
jgi:hypothetical protein